jgi:PHD/YefM family antitoxin component YafN of YafNO toxin-antitoxin module
MPDTDPMHLLRLCCDALAEDLDGQPLEITRPGEKEDMVLVSAETYAGLLERIYDLEQAALTEAEREAEEEEALRALARLSRPGRLH